MQLLFFMSITHYCTLKEGCSQLGSGVVRMFYYCIYEFIFMKRSLWHRPLFPPSPPRTPPLYALHRRKQSLLSFAMHCRLPKTFCIVDVPCDFFSTKETGHRALSAQIVARFAVCPVAMSLLSASLRVTFSRLIFFFVALRADKPPGRPCNSASAACHFINVFIFNVGRCARLAVRGREHSLTCRPLWNRSRGDNQCGCGENTAFHTQRVVRVLWVVDYVKRVLLDGVPGQCDVLFVRPRRIGRCGQRISSP